MNKIKIYKNKDIKKDFLKGKVIGIIGYGNQGKAQALNLRDSGLNVIIGLRNGSLRKKDAKSEGFEIHTIDKLVEMSDIVSFLIPDEQIPSLFSNLKLKEGQSILFSHGYVVHFKEIKLPNFVNVLLVAPSGSGKMVREEYIKGSGVPSLIAVEQDISGAAFDIALCYSKALGSTRVGSFLSTFSEETITDIFGEQAVLTGSIPSIIKESFNVLLESGYTPEIAWLVCYYEVKSIIDSFHQNGFDFLNNAISNLAEYGGATRGKRIIDENVKIKMRNILKEIEDGSFKKEWEKEKKDDYKSLYESRNLVKESEIEKITKEKLGLLKNRKKKNK